MKRIVSLLLCVILAVTLCACGGNKTPGKESEKAEIEPQAPELNADDIKTISSNVVANGFDEAFISYIAGNKSGNFMVSPVSFRYALGLLLAGAEGDTKEELLKALGVADVEEWTAYCTKFNGFVKSFYGQLDSEIEQHNEYVKKGYVDKNSPAPARALKVANSVWKRENIEKDFSEEYKKYVAANYGAEYFGFTEDNAVQKINGWVNEKTEKLIPRLLPDGYDTQWLAVVLMNALYFKDNWETAFYESATIRDDFHTEGGETVKKDFMRQTENYAYYEDGKTQAVILPMSGGINMAFVLGDESGLSEKLSKAAGRQVSVKIPKMDIETSLDRKELMNFLAENGVKSAFNRETADFSKMIDHKIWVDDIIQKTRIKTDEEGVEAAAVTAIMTKDSAMPAPVEPVEFVADRPFSFYIYATYDDVTAILFAGKMVQ